MSARDPVGCELRCQADTGSRVGSQGLTALWIFGLWSQVGYSGWKANIFTVTHRYSLGQKRNELLSYWGLKVQRRGRQRQRQKKTIGFISKTKALHVRHPFYLYISLPVFARLRRESANCALEDVNFISLSVLGYGPKKFNTRRVRLHLTKQSKQVGRNNCDYNWKNANSLFKRRSLIAIASLDLKVRIVFYTGSNKAGATRFLAEAELHCWCFSSSARFC